MALSNLSFGRTAHDGDDTALDGIDGSAEYDSDPSKAWLWKTALALFALTLVLTINAVKLGVGPIPFRLVTLLGCGAAIFLADYRALRDAVHDTRRALLIVALAALLATVASVTAKTPPANFLVQLVELHLQAILCLVIASALALRYGPRPLLLCVLGAYAITAVFALGQVLHIDAAWKARAFFGKLSGDPPITQEFYIKRYRALGLAFQPVIFGTQTCVAMAAAFYLRLTDPKRPSHGIDWVLVGSCMVFALLAVATGNRSPLLGIAVFLVVYGFLRAPKIALAVLPVFLLVALVAGPALSHLDQAGVRVAQTEDGSASNRSTLRRYGLFLIAERPLGYGLAFESTEHWQAFAHEARYMDAPLSFRQWALHNYYLGIIAKHGVLLLALAFLAIPTRRSSAFLWLPFITYALHIFYHNDGPLQGDAVVFFVIAMAIWLAKRPEHWAGTDDRALAPPKPWRRAFARAPDATRRGRRLA